MRSARPADDRTLRNLVICPVTRCVEWPVVAGKSGNLVSPLAGRETIRRYRIGLPRMSNSPRKMPKTSAIRLARVASDLAEATR